MTLENHRPAGERLAGSSAVDTADAGQAAGAGRARAVGGSPAAGTVGAGRAVGARKAAGAALREARDMAAETRRELKPHMGRRLFGWDYRQPSIYVVTIVCADRRARLFGEIEVLCDGEWLSIAEARQAKPEPDEIEARVAPSALGKAVFAHFRRIGDFTPEIVPIFCAVMPDHLHLLLRVTREMARPLGNAIAGFKTGCEKIYARSGGSGRLFAEGFVDHVIMREGQLACEFDYLRDNPRRAAVKALFPELFKVAREIGVDLRLAPQAQDKLRLAPPAGRPAVGTAGAGQAASAGQEGDGGLCSAQAAQADLLPPAQAAQAGRLRGYFSAIGNHFLLGRRLVQVQVSRRDFGYRRVAKQGGGQKIARSAAGEPEVAFTTTGFEARCDELLAEARRGAVLLSPCVSDGEREIAREALAAGLSLVTMHNKGFAPLQKPAGRYFDACAEGRLLMLAPAAWPHTPGEKPMTRDDATAMNRLCQWLAGEGAAKIAYRGVTPADVDGIALRAARASRRKSNSF